MSHFLLIRDIHRGDSTLGTLAVEGFTCQTMERPWIPARDSPAGEHAISCVPVGIYQLVTHDTPKHPRTWALVNHELDVYSSPAPGKRSDILIHPANLASQLEGCIAPGLGRQWLGEHWMVTSSRAAMTQIQTLVPWESGHTLEVKNA